jgi:hypothetical protein
MATSTERMRALRERERRGRRRLTCEEDDLRVMEEHLLNWPQTVAGGAWQRRASLYRTA